MHQYFQQDWKYIIIYDLLFNCTFSFFCCNHWRQATDLWSWIRMNLKYQLSTTAIPSILKTIEIEKRRWVKWKHKEHQQRLASHIDFVLGGGRIPETAVSLRNSKEGNSISYTSSNSNVNSPTNYPILLDWYIL